MYFQIKNVQTILRGPGGASLIRAKVGQTPIGVGVNFAPRAPGALGASTGSRIIRLPPSALAPARPGGGGMASQRIIRLPPIAPRPPPPQQQQLPVILPSEPLAPAAAAVVRTVPKKIVSTPELPVGSKVST